MPTGAIPAVAIPVNSMTINEAAHITGWSPRMLRYIEQLGLVSSPRSTGGYRLYGPAELQRLRTLRELLDRHSLGLGDVGVVRRMRAEPALAHDVDAWLEAVPSRAASGAPDDAPDSDWLAFEQDKHEHLLHPPTRDHTTKETA